MSVKIIDLKDGYTPEAEPIQLNNEIKIGSLFTATESFFRFLRKENYLFNSYYFSLKEIYEFKMQNNLPILFYMGVVPAKKFNYKEHMFLIGPDKCYLYEDDFASTFPLTIYIIK